MQEYLMAAGIREAEESTWDTELSWKEGVGQQAGELWHNVHKIQLQVATFCQNVAKYGSWLADCSATYEGALKLCLMHD
jgi:hypothetical protein